MSASEYTPAANADDITTTIRLLTLKLENSKKLNERLLTEIEDQTISKRFNQNSINYIKATAVPEVIKTQPATIGDYRSIVRMFDAENIQFHTYQLHEEKELKIVLEVFQSKQGFNPTKVTQMTNKRTNFKMPLFLVSLPKADKKIYEIRSVISLHVTIENIRATAQIGHCYRVKKYAQPITLQV